MARTKAVLGSGARLADYLAASLLARVVPAQVVNEVLDAHNCNSQRLRSFPAVVGVYYSIALSLYPEAAYEEVFAAVSQGLAWASGAAQPVRVSKVSISLARGKIGSAPLRDLVQRCCVPMADERFHPQAFYRGLRLVAIDGSRFELPDEEDNVEYFGRPGSRTGIAGYPQASCVVLAECATHAIFAANLGPYRTSEWEICQPLLASLRPDMLCLADRGFNGYEHWRQAAATEAQLLWRCADHRILPRLQELEDGSFLSRIVPGGEGRGAQAHRASHSGAGDRVRDAGSPGLAAALPAVDHAAGCQASAGAGAGGAVPRALASRTGLRRAQDASAQGPARISQQDRRARAPGVLRLGPGALRGALAAARGRYAASPGACRAVLRQPHTAAAPRTAPIRGLSPHSVQDCASASCAACSHKGPR